MEKANINGAEIAYWIDGDSENPWLVLSNSLASDHRMWAPQMSTLIQTHCVLRYDTRGHGNSQATGGEYSLDLLVSDLAGLMDSLDIDSADVLGLSLGGMTGLGLALDYPGKVSRLICCDARADAPDAYADGWHQRVEIARQKGLTALVDGTIERWLTESFRAEAANKEVVELARDMILSTSLDGFCGCAAALTTLNYRDHLSAILAPTLCVAGSEDLAAPQDVMTAMAEAIPHGQIVVVEEAAHLSNLNQPNKFNEVVSKYLRS
ncbi:MAG: alpha/beta fold hydrolase [Rhodospirillaceae bacterium]|jgi:3-oxoadipate enol-lactonase|nr:alpha/beta fold hydrolase [Rhodospirillaceae bacterium]